MAPLIERIDAVSTIIFCQNSLLMVYNKNWGAFTLPVTKLRRRQVGLTVDSSRWELGEEAASRNVAECLSIAVDRWPNLLMDYGDLRQSDRTGNINHYEFQIFGFEVDRPVTGPAIVSQWLTADEILDARKHTISPTARALVEALKESSLLREGRFPPLSTSSPRTSRSSIAIIHDGDSADKKWLCQWNKNWGRYFLVGGHREDETAEQCMVRELSEELSINPESDYGIQPRQSLQYRDWSTSAWQMTHYDVSTFDVQLNQQTAQAILSDPANRWVNAQEIRSDRCADDKLISPSTRRLLASLGELPGSPGEWNLQENDEEISTHQAAADQTVYTPDPIDTASVTLPSDVELLTEQLAENTHDVWAAQRLSEGWTHGPERDDSRKKHPCLIPYADLPNAERDYDRNTAIETLKAITALGYRIERVNE